VTRWEIVNEIIADRGYQSFLEIGTQRGETFRNVDIPLKVSVDPDPDCGATYCMTSDEYFREHAETFDIVFVDGLHECNQAFRDIRNALAVLNKGGVVVVHDCLPEDREMQEAYHGQSLWTGDVWKAFVKARAEVPYEAYVIDQDFGCGIIDTAKKRKKKPAGLPENMADMKYEDYESHPEWMGCREGWKK
jgi:hypothetical protein